MKTLSYISLFFLMVLAELAIGQTTLTGNITTHTIWTKMGSPYIIQRDVSVATNITLTIEPGVVIKFRDYFNELIINGALLAEGNAAEPIIFTTILDDTAGGDTNNDGTTTAPVVGNWSGVLFSASASKNSRLNWCQFRYGGSYATATLMLNGASPQISNCTFLKNVVGLSIYNKAAPAIANSAFEQNGVPLTRTLSANPILTNLTFNKNDANAIGLINEDLNALGTGYTLGKTNVAGIQNIPYLIYEDVRINSNVRLTIEPGVTVKFRDYFDELIVNGALIAEGTPTEPIVFTTILDDTAGGDTNSDGTKTTPSTGDWSDVLFNVGSSKDSRLNWCQFRYGGRYATSTLMLNGASPQVSNCTFLKNVVGLSMYNKAAPAIANSTFDQNGIPITRSLSGNPTLTNLNFIKNDANAIGLINEVLNAIGTSYLLGKTNVAGIQNIPYLIYEDVRINSNVRLTIEPGVIVKFRDYFDELIVNGALMAEGTPTEPIVFTTILDDTAGGDTNSDGTKTTPSTGDWSDVLFNVGSSKDSRLNWCQFRYGGRYATSTLMLNGANPEVSNCTFLKNVVGLSMYNKAAPAIANSTFDQNGIPITRSLSGNPTLSSLNFINNDANAIGLINEDPTTLDTIYYTLRKINVSGIQNIPYLIYDDVCINFNVCLKIEPGIVIKFRDYFNELIVNGTLLAEGTPTEPIIFTTILDDTAGGDTNNDGASTAPAVGSWSDISYTSISAKESRLNWCQFRYGGRAASATLVVAGASPQISNCTFLKNLTGLNINNTKYKLTKCTFEKNDIGISFTGNATGIADSLVIKAGKIGILASNNAGSIIRHSNIEANSDFGISNTSTVTIDARENWWGSSSGPQHPALNPNGQGNKVSDKVLFDPYLLQGAQDTTRKTINDLGVVALISPTKGCGLGNSNMVKIQVFNYGNAPQLNFSASYAINNIVQERFTYSGEPLLPGQSTIIAFQTPADLSVLGAYEFLFVVRTVGDSIFKNDSLRVGITNGIVSIPPIAGPSKICAGNKTILSSTGGTTYAWSNGGRGPYISVAPVQSTTYTVTVMDVNNCTASASLALEVLPSPNSPLIKASGPLTFCAGDSVILSSKEKQNIEWSNLQTTSDITVKQSGTYYLKKIETNGCTALSDALSVTVKAVPKIVTEGFTTLCAGDSVRLSISNTKAQVWSTGQTAKSIVVAPIATTTYRVQASNEGCKHTEAVNITVVPSITPAAVTEVFPESGTLGIGTSVALSWKPVANASTYDIYLWEAGQPEPLTASKTTNSISLKLNALSANTLHYWKIIAKNSCRTSNEAVYTFRTKALPDLEVYDLEVPATATAGEEILLKWKIRNVGTGGTGENTWSEDIRLGADTIYPLGVFAKDGRKKIVQNLTFLNQGQFYQAETRMTIPKDLFGAVFVFIRTGLTRGNGFIEELSTENNTLLIPVPIVVKPAPAPDLVLTSVSNPGVVFAGSQIQLNYQVKNVGDDFLAVQNWEDNIWISKTPYLDSNATLLNTQYVQWLPGQPGYHKSVSVVIPYALAGNYYLIVAADFANGLDELSENNNTGASSAFEILTFPPSDLIVESVSASGTSIFAGDSITISWSVKNQGANAPQEVIWRDKLYLSTQANFDSASAILLGEFRQLNQRKSLMPGARKVYKQSFRVPVELKGNYYLFAFVDADSLVYEPNFDNNNTTRSAQIIQVKESYANLVLTQVSTAGNRFDAGGILPVTYTISNQGIRSNQHFWRDSLYLSKDRFFSPDDIPLGSFFRDTILQEGNSLTIKTFAVLSTKLSPGDYFLIVAADAANEVYEAGFEGFAGGNLFISSNPLSIQSLFSISNADLAVTRVSTNGVTPYSGQQLKLNWTVENRGAFATNQAFWIDSLFLSKNDVLDAADLYLGSKKIIDTLETGMSYSAAADLVLPDGISAERFLFVKAYTGKELNDVQLSNNFAFIPINIQLSPYPDLFVQQLTLSDTVFVAGQTIRIPVAIANQGRAALPANDWYFGAAFTNKPQRTKSSTWIGTEPGRATLNPGESYTDTLAVTIPVNLNGYYYLHLELDINSGIYETNETNNNYKTLVRIVPQQPLDLILTNFSSPSSAFLGDDIELQYEVQNNGTTAAYGRINNGVWLSIDDVLNRGADPLIGTVDASVDKLEPGGAIKISHTLKLKDVTPWSYHAIGAIDLRNSIPETNEANNVFVRPDKLGVGIRELALKKEENFPLTTNDYRYYRIAVEAGLDLVLTIDSDQDDEINNEVWIGYNKVPNALDYDHKNESQNGADQAVLVSNTKAGYYYILIREKNRIQGNTKVQQVKILARALSFSVLIITPAKVGQGLITTTMTGAAFRPNTKIYLEHPITGLRKAEGQIVEYINSMKMKVRWQLDTVKLGLYHVIAQNDGTTARLENGLEVEAKRQYACTYEVNRPKRFVKGRISTVGYYHQNVSNVDIPYITGSYYFADALRFLKVEKSANMLTQTEISKNAGLGDDTDPWVSHGGVHRIDYVVKGLEPGEAFSINFTFDTISNLEQFPGAFYAWGFGGRTYAAMRLLQIERIRTQLIQNPESIELRQRDQTLAFALDSLNFRDSMLREAIGFGLLNAQDTIGLGSLGLNIPEYGQARNIEVIDDDNMEDNLSKVPDNNLEKKLIDEESERNVALCELFFDAIGTGLDIAGCAAISGTGIGLAFAIGGCGLSLVSDAASLAKDINNLLSSSNRSTGITDQGSSIDFLSSLTAAMDAANLLYDLDDLIASLRDRRDIERLIRLVDSKGEFVIFDSVVENWLEANDNISSGTTQSLQGVASLAATILGSFCDDWFGSHDPNAIYGPQGYGPERFISSQSALPYEVRFENDDSLATAAARTVTISVPLPKHADPLSFRLGRLGFGTHQFEVPQNQASWFQRLNLPDSLVYDVEVTAGVDVARNRAFWRFNTIDPLTGLSPTDPEKGFLPVNDLLGSGEGFVSFTIQARSNTKSADSLALKASIVFDVNPPILTNTWLNTIDAQAPTSKVISPTLLTDSTFTIKVAAKDDPLGSGLASYDLYLSNADSVNYRQLGSYLQLDSTYVFNGRLGQNYCLYSIARDNVQNVEAPKAFGDNCTDALVEIKSPSGSTFCQSDTILIQFKKHNLSQVEVFYSADEGLTYLPLLSNVSNDVTSFKWVVPKLAKSGNQYQLRIVESKGVYEKLSLPFAVVSDSDTTYITATTNDPSKIGKEILMLSNAAGCKSVVVKTTTLVTSNKEISPLHLDYRLFPNPTKGEVVLEFSKPLLKNSWIQVFNVQGNVVLKQKMLQGSTLVKATLQGLDSNLYFVQIVSEDGLSTFKKLVLTK